MGNPTFLLDNLIATNQFSTWIDAREDRKNEQRMWEMYLHKLGAWDNRTFNEFRSDMMKNQKTIVKASDEQLKATVKSSLDILNDFNFTERK